MTSTLARPVAFMIGAVLLVSACGGAAVRRDPAVPPSLTIERFLRAANENDLDTMISLFGTREGSVRGEWGKEEADRRMFLITNVLRHTDYTVGPEQIVPGRRDEAAQFNVRLVTQRDGTLQVPMTLVWSRHGQWLVENIPVDRITRPGGGL